MEYLIFSQIECCLKINGQYSGIINLNPKSFNIEQTDLIQFIPLNSFAPISFILNNPIEQVKIINSQVCNFIFPVNFLYCNLGYQTHLLEQFNNFSLQVLTDGIGKIILLNNNNHFVETFTSKFDKISIFYKDNEYIGLLFKGERQLFILLDTVNFKTIFYKYIDEIYLENGTIIIKIFPPTLLNHQVKYTIKKGIITRSILRGKEPPTLLEPSLFCFAFLECLSLKDNVQDFLSAEINEEKLIEFLGDFDYILPLQHTTYQFAIISKSAKFLSFKLQNNKIFDIETN